MTAEHWLRWTTRAALAVALVCGASACAPRADPPVRVGVSAWPGYEPLLLARDLGYLDEQRVAMYELPTSNLTFESLHNGSVDLAALSLNEYFELVRGGTRARIVAVLDRSNGADAAMAVPSVRTLADLRGRRIILPNFSFVGSIVLSHMLDAAGLKYTDVGLVVVPEERMDAVLRAGQADVAISYEPHLAALAALGLHDLYDSRSFPNEVLDVLVAREAVVQERREEICEVVRQWFHALEFVQAEPRDANARMGRRNQQSAEQFAASLRGLEFVSRAQNLELLDGAHPGILDTAQAVSRVMMRDGKWSQPIDIQPSILGDLRTCTS